MADILISGASGFIGRWLCRTLTQQGHSVYALLRDPSQLPKLREQCTQLGGRGEALHGIHGDIRQPLWGLSEPPRWQTIYHLAAQFAWQLSEHTARASNVQGSLHAVDLAAQQDARLILIGGFMACNTDYLAELGIDPQQPERSDWSALYRRSGAYEASKLEGLFRTQAYAHEREVALTCVHPATVCGDAQHGQVPAEQPFAQLLQALQKKRLRAVPGSPAHWLPLVSADSLAALLASLVNVPAEQAPPQLLAMDPQTPALGELLQQLAGALSVPAPRGYVPLRLLDGLLRLPLLARYLMTSREGLAFIRRERLTDAYQATAHYMQAQALHWPTLSDCLARSAQYALAQTAGIKKPGQ